MPAQKKIDVVASLKEKLREAQAVVLTDYTGLTHPQLEDLHKSLKNLKAQFIVVKNSLLRLALKGVRCQVSGVRFERPTAVLITTTDDLSPIRAVHQKGQELNGLKIKWGIWQGEIITQDQVIHLATLPNREVLLGQVVSQLSTPQTRLLYALKGNLQKLVYLLQKKTDGPAQS